MHKRPTTDVRSPASSTSFTFSGVRLNPSAYPTPMTAMVSSDRAYVLTAVSDTIARRMTLQIQNDRLPGQRRPELHEGMSNETRTDAVGHNTEAQHIEKTCRKSHRCQRNFRSARSWTQTPAIDSFTMSANVSMCETLSRDHPRRRTTGEYTSPSRSSALRRDTNSTNSTASRAFMPNRPIPTSTSTCTLGRMPWVAPSARKRHMLFGPNDLRDSRS